MLLYLNSFNENSPNPISFSSTKIVDKPVAKLISDVHGHFHDSELSQAIVIWYDLIDTNELLSRKFVLIIIFPVVNAVVANRTSRCKF